MWVIRTRPTDIFTVHHLCPSSLTMSYRNKHKDVSFPKNIVLGCGLITVCGVIYQTDSQSPQVIMPSEGKGVGGNSRLNKQNN